MTFQQTDMKKLEFKSSKTKKLRECQTSGMFVDKGFLKKKKMRIKYPNVTHFNCDVCNIRF